MMRRRRMGTLVDGEARPSGSDEWAPARFALSDRGAPTLFVQVDTTEGATPYPLADITGLDELLGDFDDRMHVEIVSATGPPIEALWPEPFADLVVAALAATVTTPVATSADSAGNATRPPAALIAALAVAGVVAIIVGAVGLSRSDDGPPTTRPQVACERTSRCDGGQ